MDFRTFAVCMMIAIWALAVPASAQRMERELLKIGGFRCVDLKPLRNDTAFDLYRVGYWSHAGFGMDVWKRHGVPFWYPRETGNIRVAGADWTPTFSDAVSLAENGAVARANADGNGNGRIEWANDGNIDTYWYAGDNRRDGKLWIDFSKPVRISSISFLGWATPRHSPKDYSVGVILPDGSEKEIASVKDEKRMGEWIKFSVDKIEAKGIYIDVRSTMEAEHGPVIYEFAAKGEGVERVERVEGSQKSEFASEIVVPLGTSKAQEVFCLGHVGEGFDSTPDVETPVGEYALTYENGETQIVPLVAGRNVASVTYGHFVPEAEFFLGFRGRPSANPDEDKPLAYHLDEMLPVSPRSQIMMSSFHVSRPDVPLKSLTFRCTNAKASLVLAGITLHQSGPRMNALVYKGKTVRPYPAGIRKAKPSPIDALRDKSRILSLDGKWQYMTDPGNVGFRRGYCLSDFDAAVWKTMPVPSQWYVQGLDYHGVVWFRKEFSVPESFPGSVMVLNFVAVDYDARVWVNDEYIGRHIGSSASFKLDATTAIRKGGKNIIVVRVDSPVDPGFTPEKTLIKGNCMDDIAMPYNEEGCQGGIYRSVSLIGRGDVGIENAWTVGKVSEDLKWADVSIRFDLIGKQAGDVKVSSKLTETGGSRRVFTAEKKVSVLEKTAVELGVAVPNPRLWYPWEQGKPELHILEIEVRRGEELLDRHVSRVGIREVTFNEKESCVYVNHHRIFLKGMLNDDIHWMSMMDRTGYRQRIQLQKDANLNVIRLTTHQSSPDFYDLCDEMGMMIWQEMPLQWGYSSTQPIRDDIETIVAETVTQCRPHASIIGWSAWNEGGQGEFSDKISKMMRDLDPTTRPLTKACGYGGFDIHIYPNLSGNLSRMTALWSGIKVGFVSEVGAYGLSSLDEMKEICGDDLFPFDGADYFWEIWNSYRYCDGPVFLDAPNAADWPTEKIREYMLSKIEPSERWLCQFMKYMYEHLRAMRFEPTTAAIHCRFDDPLPTAFLGNVNFNGRPRKAYYATQQACQQVLPIMFFDYTGVEDVRVINEYWSKSWKGCALHYKLTDRDGNVIRDLKKTFDLPADSTVKVLTREEAGDVWHLPGFFAELEVRDARGKLLSKNNYDLTEDEVRAFVTTVYPPPPTKPVDSIVIKAANAVELRGVTERIDVEGAYSKRLLMFGGDEPYLKFQIDAPKEGRYLVRAACDSGQALRTFELYVDGKKAELENQAYVDMTQGITRVPYTSHNLSWRPGWTVDLSKGSHVIELKWPEGRQAQPIILDALCLQDARSK